MSVQPPDVTQAQTKRTWVAIVSITDEKAKVAEAIKNADVARLDVPNLGGSGDQGIGSSLESIG